MRLSLPTLFCTHLALLTACTGSSGPASTSSNLDRATPTVATDQLKAAAKSESDFAIDLYKQLAPQKQNLFFSPHSIAEALTMTYAGAAGTTKSEMRSVLHITLPDADEHAAMNALDLTLQSRGQGQKGADGQPFRLRVANALWGQQGHSFLPTYLDTISVNYGAGIELVDFESASEPSRIQINDWVAQKTENKVVDLLPKGFIDGSTRLVLTNAVYFNAAWSSPFETSATTSQPFTTPSGSVTALTMQQTGSMRAAISAATDGSAYQAVSIPYAGNQLSMIVVRPDDLSSFESTFDAARLAQILSDLQPSEVHLSLPSWKLTDTTALAEQLSALGMKAAFDNADFSGIDGTHDLAISKVQHKAYVMVNEAGTEAAAATAVAVTTSAIGGPLVEIKVDRPFLYLIRDDATGAVVFLGRIVDPTL